MKRADKRRWAGAASLADLGEMTALWLEGKLSETPGYLGPPDPETEEIAPVLARLNRSGGILTYSSQPGYDGPGHDGARWIQRAAVEFLAEPHTADRIRGDASAAGFIVVAHRPPSPRVRDRYDDAVGVTGRQDPETGAWSDTCSFGAWLSRRTLREEFAGCSAEAVAAVCGAYQVTLGALISGEDDRLWRWLDGWLDRRAAS